MSLYDEPHDGKAHVIVDNLADFRPAIRTEEVEPEHFITSTFVLQQSNPQLSMGQGTSRNDIAQVLDLDPLRKSAAIQALDTAIVVCDSYKKAADAANQVAGVPFPQGLFLAVGGTVNVDGTGPLWVVNTVPATQSRVGCIINRRGK